MQDNGVKYVTDTELVAYCLMHLYLSVCITGPQHQKYLAFIRRLVTKVGRLMSTNIGDT